jgi:hypothetical protein
MVAMMFMAFALSAAAATPPTIYRCPGSDGETMFSDLPCPGGQTQTMQPVISLDMSHFSADEQATLDRLQRADASPRAAMPPRPNAKTQDDRCEAARDGLDRVRASKRRGYRASSAAALDARERRYEAQRDRACR